VFHVISIHGGRHDYFAVTPEIAEKLQKHPMIIGGKDGLFPGLAQTWRLLTDGGSMEADTHST
jgi:hypothetical protein